MRQLPVKRTLARMDFPSPDEELDLKGLKCPLPALMTARALRRLPSGARLAIFVTDPLAPLDIRFLCEREGHAVIEQTTGEDAVRILVRCK
jgi:tRNA 2-thiouridine synthesizing protein A